MSKPLKEDYIIRIKSRIEQRLDEPAAEEEKRRICGADDPGQLCAEGRQLLCDLPRDRDHRLRGLYYHPEDRRRRQPGGDAAVRQGRRGRYPAADRKKGRRNLCHYETGFGSMTLGVTADEIDCQLTEKGGTARFSPTCWMPTAPSL